MNCHHRGPLYRELGASTDGGIEVPRRRNPRRLSRKRREPRLSNSLAAPQQSNNLLLDRHRIDVQGADPVQRTTVDSSLSFLLPGWDLTSYGKHGKLCSAGPFHSIRRWSCNLLNTLLVTYTTVNEHVALGAGLTYIARNISLTSSG